MSGPKKQYLTELKNKFGYYATWHPGKTFIIGDIGIYTNNDFTKLVEAKNYDYKIKYDVIEDNSIADIEYNSQGNVVITSKLSGVSSPMGSSLSIDDTGIIFEFGNENSIFFKIKKVITQSIKDKINLGKQILKLYREGKWNKKWVIITELLIAESATILISNNKNAKIELKANTNIKSNNIDILDLDFDFSIIYSKGLETKIIAEKGCTPLYKIMGIKTKLILNPEFHEKGLSPGDLITPDKAKKEYKHKLYFDYIE